MAGKSSSLFSRILTSLLDEEQNSPTEAGVKKVESNTVVSTTSQKNSTFKSHLVIPDCQVKEGVDVSHMNHIGQYIVHKQPDVVVCLGDFADMPSLSSYDKGRKSFEGRRYAKDVEAVKHAMDELMQPIKDFNKLMKRRKKTQYKPRMIMLLGNHEHRIDRAVEADAILEDTISTSDLGYAEAGWEVHPFLDVVEVDGVLYSHFFPRSPSGRVMQNKRGAPSASAQVKREMKSCTSGHLQGLDFSIYQTGHRRYYGLIAGSCYLHDEDYLTSQGTAYWRGIVYKNEVINGQYDPMFVSLDYLRRRSSKEDV